MDKIRLGVICPSEIALRRFMPSLFSLTDKFEYIGVAIASADEWGNGYSVQTAESEHSKSLLFKEQYGGRIFDNYTSLITSQEIDAVYLPLPPGLHYKWGRKVLEAGKHLFVEKPSTTASRDTEKLVSLARERNLALHENYMFQYHSQITYIQKMIADGKVGDIRLYRVYFGFPRRSDNDFRYNKSLGGGALLDCGGYTIKLATMLLGDSAKIVTSKLNYLYGLFDVDIFGSATIVNDEGLSCQVAFGMDNAYKCELEVWGSKATIYTNRILTAPAGFEPVLIYKYGNSPAEEIKLPSDDTFKKSIEKFHDCVTNNDVRIATYREIQKQADMVNQIQKENG